MTDRIVFVVFDGADEAYANKLAGALAPMSVLPSPLGATEGQVRFGYGSLCLVLWTPALAAHGDAVVATVADGADNALVCRLPGATSPPRGFARTLDLTGELQADADALRTALSVLPPSPRARGGSRHAPRLGAHARASGPRVIKSPDRKRRFVARSAFGLGVTFAVAAIAAHLLSQRASATRAADEEVAAVVPPSVTTSTAAPPQSPLAADDAGAPQPIERGEPARTAEPAALQPASAMPAPSAERDPMETATIDPPAVSEHDATPAAPDAETGEQGSEALTEARDNGDAVAIEGPSL